MEFVVRIEYKIIIADDECGQTTFDELIPKINYIQSNFQDEKQKIHFELDQ